MTDPQDNRVYRDGTADLLKGFAVLFMIQVHIMEQFATPDIFNSSIGKISMFLGGPPCAPVFMAVMGYFLAKSSRPFIYFLKRALALPAQISLADYTPTRSRKQCPAPSSAEVAHILWPLTGSFWGAGAATQSGRERITRL